MVTDLDGPRQPPSRKDAERLIRETDPFTEEGALQIATAYEWLFEREPDGPTLRDVRYFHGGAPGLKPGDLLLPPDTTGADRVFVATVPVVAWAHAANHQQGHVYQVKPLGRLEPDPNFEGPPGVSFRVPKARVLRGRTAPDWERCLAHVARDVPVLSHITDNLWVGAVADGERLPDDFAHVVALHPEGRYRLGPNTTLHECDLRDPSEAEIFQLGDELNDLRRDGPTLVHCKRGFNRSGVLAATALVRDGMRPDDAIALLRERRSPLVLAKPTFEQWVREVQPAGPVG